MFNGVSSLREFGELRLDTQKKTLWHNGEPVAMPLKELDVLCMLVERPGELVTKDEILDRVWQDSFVEESNLSRHIYLLRKTLKQLGQNDDLIQNVPRRGYRFAGEVREVTQAEIVVEKHSQTRTTIEITEDVAEAAATGFFVARKLSLSATLAAVLLTVLAGGGAYFGYRYSLAKNLKPQIKSLAVLPFRTIGPGGEGMNQGLGLADVLITRLGSLEELTVRPTSAVVAFEGGDSTEAGKKLAVDAVLEGTIYQANDNVRVTARLINVGDGAAVWSGEFEKPARDELRLQDEIALRVVDALAVNLTGNERAAIAKRHTANKDAYQLYVSGRIEWNKRTWRSMNEARLLFRNAIDADPDFALAHAGLADAIAMSGSVEAFEPAEKALALDPDLAEAHASMGFLQMFHKWEWDAAESSFKRSIELNPNYATAHHWYATLLAITGRNDEAKAEMRRALEINPYSHNFLADLGQLHYFAREYDEAKIYCRRALEIYPEFVFAREHLADIYLQTGEYDKSVEEEIAAMRINSSLMEGSAEGKRLVDEQLAHLRTSYAERGIRGYMMYRFSGIGTDPDNHFGKALSDSFLGENAAALDNLERAVEQKTFIAAFIKADPIFDGLRDEPRYREILRKMKLGD